MRKIFLLFCAIALANTGSHPAHAQMYNAGDPCPELTAGRIFTQEGAAGPSLVCNGTTLEVDQSITTGPYARGIGTATPKAPLHVAGEAIIGATTGLACDADRLGGIRFNPDLKVVEICRDIALGWEVLKGAGSGGICNSTQTYATAGGPYSYMVPPEGEWGHISIRLWGGGGGGGRGRYGNNGTSGGSSSISTLGCQQHVKMSD